MGLANVDYKKIVFSRYDGIDVSVIADLKNPFDLDESFLVLDIDGIDTPKEINLFYWIDLKRWTLNEFQYFALNNTMCIQIYDKQENEITSYGYCANSVRVHDLIFGINFD